MRCETCHGTGKLRLPPIPTYAGQTGDGYHNIIAWRFWCWCPDCGGCGFAHCCEGERPGNTGGAPNADDESA